MSGVSLTGSDLGLGGGVGTDGLNVK